MMETMVMMDQYLETPDEHGSPDSAQSTTQIADPLISNRQAENTGYHKVIGHMQSCDLVTSTFSRHTTAVTKYFGEAGGPPPLPSVMCVTTVML